MQYMSICIFTIHWPQFKIYVLHCAAVCTML